MTSPLADPREFWSAARRPGRVGAPPARLNTGGAYQRRRSVSGNRPDQGRRGRKVHLFK